MKTLIFKSVGTVGKTSTKPEFVKEGDFTDALNYFGDKYWNFHHQEGDEGFNPEICENGYYTDSNGELIITQDELDSGNEHNWDINNTFDRGVYTVNSNNLSNEELKNLVSQGWLPDSFKLEIIEENELPEVFDEDESYDIEVGGRMFYFPF